MKVRSHLAVAALFLLAALASAQDLASFEKRITTKKLDNGLTVIVCERPEAPVFSFTIQVDAGSAQDPMGQTGLAHMFEHMAFKGTSAIGTKDAASEKTALAKVEAAYAAYNGEQRKAVGIVGISLVQASSENLGNTLSVELLKASRSGNTALVRQVASAMLRPLR